MSHSLTQKLVPSASKFPTSFSSRVRISALVNLSTPSSRLSPSHTTSDSSTTPLSPSHPDAAVASDAAAEAGQIAESSASQVSDHPYLGKIVTVCGWSRTVRKQGGGQFCFVCLNDGSTVKNLQVVVESSMDNYDSLLRCGVGCSFRCTGQVVTSPASGQHVELSCISMEKGHRLDIYGMVDQAKYPLAKKQHSRDFLREIGHLRPRTYVIGAVSRIRSNMAMATHRFFQDRGFLYVHTPIITTADCEGGGELFQVTTLLPDHTAKCFNPMVAAKQAAAAAVAAATAASAAATAVSATATTAAAATADAAAATSAAASATAAAAAGSSGAASSTTASTGIQDSSASAMQSGPQTSTTTQHKRQEDNACSSSSSQTLSDSKSLCSSMATSSAPSSSATSTDTELYSLPLTKQSTLNYKADFFGKPAYLTCSGQLAVENFCCSLSDVYTFGPTFRAEKSHTSRHLAEFWMIEPELAFADINDNMDCAEAFLRYCVEWVLMKCEDDIKWLDTNCEQGLQNRLQKILEEPFKRLTYTDAVTLLQAHNDKFSEPVSWGIDLASEHERYLTEKIFERPLIVYDYPKDIKAFYMRLNDDGKTVAAMDVLLPHIGEVIGGAQREERLEVLDAMIEEKGLDKKAYWWYRELRQFGTIPHSGFGVGFERLIMMVTGVDNIRDVIPFPRYPQHAEF
eukprot:GHVQ01017876.1.p1 GENE.GHVQ01017876.1~~GHVQ01017876.1.p1  ORF type:complete len:685 (+),score=143.11 GHVQ01017876.1:209-2263(+)